MEQLPKPVAEVHRPSVSWWPVFLQGEVNIEDVRKKGFSPYVHIGGLVVPAVPNERLVYLFLINWSEGKGFFYEAIDSNGAS